MFVPLKIRLFLPVSLTIIAIIIGLSIWHIKNSINNFNRQMQESLVLEVKTISRMFERENMLKMENVQKNLLVTSKLFGKRQLRILETQTPLMVENQKNGQIHETNIKKWLLDNNEMLYDSIFVDNIHKLLGGTVTIFQRIDSGFVRLSTNVLNDNNQRSVGTYIPNNSPVVQSVLNGNTYYGRAYVVNDWYTTAYEPIMYDGNIIGMLYVGDKEKDLDELRKILLRLQIGKSGYPFVFNKDGYMLIHPEMGNSVYEDKAFFENIGKSDSGVFRYIYKGKQKTVAFKYFEPFDVYIAASVYNDEENRAFIKQAVIGTSVVSLLAAILLIAFIYYFTSEKLYKFIIRLQISNRKIAAISEALKESEERFQKLFDSTGDDIFVTDSQENIVEVNNATCKSLGYTREELLKKKITEIKTPKYKDTVSENRRIIYERGNYTFESEHVAKDGTVMAVEFTSRMVSYKNENLILSVVRNISERKELERKVLSAVILAEERERERFAKDMHDGLGPLLSTIKLYVNELKSATMSAEEREDFIKSSNELIDEAVNATRTISNNLMPRIISSYGLIKAVDEFCKKVNKTNKLSIMFDTENITDRLSPDIEIILFRVISELINNTIKHAKAEKVIVLLVKYETKIALYYKDDGIGFDTDEIINDTQKGMGLKNIISRVKSINGTYSFSSSHNKGFSIKIEFYI